jgi:excisionase family DNA binding protein
MSSILLAANDFVVDDAAHIEAAGLLNQTGDVDRLRFSVDLQDGNHVVLSDSISTLLEAVLNVAAQGGKVTFTTLPSEMTTAAAASWLGISRPTLMKFVREGKIPAHKAGSHTRIKTEDLFQYRERQNDNQRKVFAELREISEIA